MFSDMKTPQFEQGNVTSLWFIINNLLKCITEVLEAPSLTHQRESRRILREYVDMIINYLYSNIFV